MNTKGEGQIPEAEIERMKKDCELSLRVMIPPGVSEGGLRAFRDIYLEAAKFEYLRSVSPSIDRDTVKAVAKNAYQTCACLPSEFDKWFDDTYPEIPKGDRWPRWVKAAERLPTVGAKMVFLFRVADDEPLAHYGEYGEDHVGPYFGVGAGPIYYLAHFVDRIEWLEEQPSESPAITDK